MTQGNPDTPLKESPLFWPTQLKGEELLVLDETLIPKKIHYIKVTDLKGVVEVIKEMKTRAFGQFLVVMSAFLLIIEKNKSESAEKLFALIKEAAEALNNSRPTFPFREVTDVVVNWASEALANPESFQPCLVKNIQGYLGHIRHERLGRVMKLAEILEHGDSILTHCNVSGELAMAAHVAKEQKRTIHVFATETRPYMQGAKLTCWELEQMGIRVTLIADNAVGTVMSDGLVSKVVIGSDRSCANGDVANKIGSYQIAVLAREFGLPLYVLTQPSNRVKRGEDIPIEIRNATEMLDYIRKEDLGGFVDGFYPGFDVVPNELITQSIAINVR